MYLMSFKAPINDLTLWTYMRLIYSVNHIKPNFLFPKYNKLNKPSLSKVVNILLQLFET